MNTWPGRRSSRRGAARTLVCTTARSAAFSDRSHGFRPAGGTSLVACRKPKTLAMPTYGTGALAVAVTPVEVKEIVYQDADCCPIAHTVRALHTAASHRVVGHLRVSSVRSDQWPDLEDRGQVTNSRLAWAASAFATALQTGRRTQREPPKHVQWPVCCRAFPRRPATNPGFVLSMVGETSRNSCTDRRG